MTGRNLLAFLALGRSRHQPASSVETALSLIVPCYNEAAVIGITHPRLVSALAALEADWKSST
jgi:hypothetical protein